MNNKRILILHESTSGPLQLRNSRHKVVTCTSTTEALSILMGGSSAFGKDDYAKTGKVRPEILVLDSAFLESFEGFELLEIIRKYYTLQSVRILIFDKNITLLDPAIFSRYKISGKLTPNYNLDELTESNSEPAAARSAGIFLSAGLLAGMKDWVTTGLNFLKGQSLAITGMKTVVAGKVAIAGSCVVVAGFVVTPMITEEKNSESTHRTEKKVISIQDPPSSHVVTKQEPVRTLTVEVLPPAEEKPEKRKKIEIPAVKEETQQPVATQEPASRPERQFRIGVEEAEESLEAQATQ